MGGGRKRKHSTAAAAKSVSTRHQLAARKAAGVGLHNNPFETRTTKRTKRAVLGRKIKGQNRNLSRARADAEQRRKETLLVEYQQRHSANQFVDRRLGQHDRDMSADDKALLRFQKQRMKQLSRGNKFNLGDDSDSGGDEILTHGGQDIRETLAAEAKRRGRGAGGDGFGSGSDDEGLEAEMVDRAHFGGGGGGNPHVVDGKFVSRKGPKTHKEVIAEIVAKSKFYKAERRKEANLREQQLEQLDGDLDDIRGLLNFRQSKAETREQEKQAMLASLAKGEKPRAAAPRPKREKKQIDDYDRLRREMTFEARARASDRTKSAEEMMREEAKRLAKLEQERLARMREDVSDDESGSDDDDAGRGYAGRRERIRRRADKAAGGDGMTGDDLEENFMLDMDDGEDEDEAELDEEGQAELSVGAFADSDDEDDDDEDDERKGFARMMDEDEDEDEGAVEKQATPKTPLSATTTTTTTKKKKKKRSTQAEADEMSAEMPFTLPCIQDWPTLRSRICRHCMPSTTSSTSTTTTTTAAARSNPCAAEAKLVRELLRRVRVCNSITHSADNARGLRKFLHTLMGFLVRLATETRAQAQDGDEETRTSAAAGRGLALMDVVAEAAWHVAVEIPSEAAELFTTQLIRTQQRLASGLAGSVGISAAQTAITVTATKKKKRSKKQQQQQQEGEAMELEELPAATLSEAAGAGAVAEPVPGAASAAWLGVGELALLRLLAAIFPTSDYRHPVATPAMLVLAQCLAQAPVAGADKVELQSQVVLGLTAASIALEASLPAQRLVPEALNFIVAVLAHSFVTTKATKSKATKKTKKTKKKAKKKGKKKADASDASADADAPSAMMTSRDADAVARKAREVCAAFGDDCRLTWLPSQPPSSAQNMGDAATATAPSSSELFALARQLRKDASKAGASKPALAPGAAKAIVVMPGLVLTQCLRMLRRVSDRLLRGAGIDCGAELLAPARAALRVCAASLHEQVARAGDTAPERRTVLQGLERECAAVATHLARAAEAGDVMRRSLQLQAKVAKKEIKQLVPAFDMDFEPTRDKDPDRAAVEQKRLKKMVKAERKGAARELRRDADFLSRAREEKRRAADAKKAAKRKEIRAFVEAQQAGFKQMVREGNTHGGGSGGGGRKAKRRDRFA